MILATGPFAAIPVDGRLKNLFIYHTFFGGLTAFQLFRQVGVGGDQRTQ